jgi:hypothetical protein
VNVKVLQWLLKNQAVLRKVADVASGWKASLSYAEKWAIVDSIAKLLIPVLESDTVTAKALLTDEGDVRFMSAMQEEVSALGIDWAFIRDTVIPLVIMALQIIGRT